jgi:hypothetical protein
MYILALMQGRDGMRDWIGLNGVVLAPKNMYLFSLSSLVFYRGSELIIVFNLFSVCLPTA